MTFILNILHKDMSILAADRRAIAESPPAETSEMAIRAGVGSVVDDYDKITLILGQTLALGISGHTHDHFYLPTLRTSSSIDDALSKIRQYIERSLRVHDRPSLSTLTSIMANQGIASFFDEALGAYFSTEFLFSPIESNFRLYRGSDRPQIIYAGSGSSHFEKEIGQAGIDSFVSSLKNSCTPDSCISWMQEVYRKVSANDPWTGPEAGFMVSIRSSPKFRST